MKLRDDGFAPVGFLGDGIENPFSGRESPWTPEVFRQ